VQSFPRFPITCNFIIYLFLKVLAIKQDKKLNLIINTEHIRGLKKILSIKIVKREIKVGEVKLKKKYFP
jgi:hypothetical protein